MTATKGNSLSHKTAVTQNVGANPTSPAKTIAPQSMGGKVSKRSRRKVLLQTASLAAGTPDKHLPPKSITQPSEKRKKQVLLFIAKDGILYRLFTNGSWDRYNPAENKPVRQKRTTEENDHIHDATKMVAESDWEKEFDKRFHRHTNSLGFNGPYHITEIKAFIRSLLFQRDHDQGILATTIIDIKNQELADQRNELIQKVKGMKVSPDYGFINLPHKGKTKIEYEAGGFGWHLNTGWNLALNQMRRWAKGRNVTKESLRHYLNSLKDND